MRLIIRDFNDSMRSSEVIPGELVEADVGGVEGGQLTQVDLREVQRVHFDL